jgi:hypothetical protein
MKKTLFSIFSFFALLFCFPLSTLGSVMEATVTINSVRIPERSVMAQIPDLPNTEFEIDTSRITIVDSGNIVIKSGNFPTAYYYANTLTWALKSGAQVTLSFPYDASKTPYKVYVETQATAQGANVVCKADCSPVAANSGWYYSRGGAYFWGDSHGVNGWMWIYALCTNPPCGSNYRGNIAFDPAHVVADSVTPTEKYWRSSVLFTIN